MTTSPGRRPAFRIATDADLSIAEHMPLAIEAIRDALRAHADESLTAPARVRASVGPGDFVFTTGGCARRGIFGFRAYNDFTPPGRDEDQVVTVFDAEGRLRGLCLGEKLGRIRTGAIGGCAVDLLARRDARTLAIIGAGRQAEAQLHAVLAVREIAAVRISSRSSDRVAQFAARAESSSGLPVTRCATVDEAIDGADIVVLATTSTTPLLAADQVAAGTHITTVGPKRRGQCELDPEVARGAVIATDSPSQARGYPDPFFLDDAEIERLVSLSRIASDPTVGRTHDHQVTLFCSVGLAGTEVFVADRLLGVASRAGDSNGRSH
ncbi:MAG: ornithine cyclodeaminase family protein [Planctomycetes bacterium]|nr:ornithine cyclodeaminase family protein [Planctomycetota bacterium]